MKRIMLLVLLPFFMLCLSGCLKDECAKNGLYGDGYCDDWCPKPDPDCEDQCEQNGLYGDGVCDDWCPKPDPDCDTSTTTTTIKREFAKYAGSTWAWTFEWQQTASQEFIKTHSTISRSPYTIYFTAKGTLKIDSTAVETNEYGAEWYPYRLTISSTSGDFYRPKTVDDDGTVCEGAHVTCPPPLPIATYTGDIAGNEIILSYLFAPTPQILSGFTWENVDSDKGYNHVIGFGLLRECIVKQETPCPYIVAMPEAYLPASYQYTFRCYDPDPTHPPQDVTDWCEPCDVKNVFQIMTPMIPGTYYIEYSGPPGFATFTLDCISGCDADCEYDSDCDDGSECTRDECVDRHCVNTPDDLIEPTQIPGDCLTCDNGRVKSLKYETLSTCEQLKMETIRSCSQASPDGNWIVYWEDFSSDGETQAHFCGAGEVPGSSDSSVCDGKGDCASGSPFTTLSGSVDLNSQCKDNRYQIECNVYCTICR